MASLPLFASRDDASRLWTVSELTGRICQTLEAEFGDVGLCGEVSNVSRPRSGHVYFKIKDEAAAISAVLWKSTVGRLVFELEDGLAVRAWGDLTVYAPKGEYQIIVRKIEPEGIGALELAFRQMVARLAAEGLFDPKRKRPLPAFPKRIAVVTSPTGAAIRDILHVTGRRWSATEILVVPVRVQGAGAAEEIAEGIALANRIADVDLILIGRGGGSLEDLWAFNQEVVARAIVASERPVVSAVGHEIDVTIADMAADLRAPTPSAAGALCVPDAREIRSVLDGLARRLARAGQAAIQEARTRLDSLSDRARRALQRDLDHRRHRLAQVAGRLNALSPLAVLARGYSLTLNEDGRTVVRSASDVRPGDRIHTRLAQGRLISRIEQIENSQF